MISKKYGPKCVHVFLLHLQFAFYFSYKNTLLVSSVAEVEKKRNVPSGDYFTQAFIARCHQSKIWVGQGGSPNVSELVYSIVKGMN